MTQKSTTVQFCLVLYLWPREFIFETEIKFEVLKMTLWDYLNGLKKFKIKHQMLKMSPLLCYPF